MAGHSQCRWIRELQCHSSCQQHLLDYFPMQLCPRQQPFSPPTQASRYRLHGQIQENPMGVVILLLDSNISLIKFKMVNKWTDFWSVFYLYTLYTTFAVLCTTFAFMRFITMMLNCSRCYTKIYCKCQAVFSFCNY